MVFTYQVYGKSAYEKHEIGSILAMVFEITEIKIHLFDFDY